MCFIFYFSIFFLFAPISARDKFLERLSNLEWVCANENCSEPISIAKTKQAYNADHELKVSFRGREDVNIFGKPTNEKENIWLVSVGDKFGVVSKDLLKETSILVSPHNCTTTKYDFSIFNTSTEKHTGSKRDIKPSPTVEVIDGTTVSHELSEIDESVTVTGEDPISDYEDVDDIKSAENDFKAGDQNSQDTPSENEVPPSYTSTPPDELPSTPATEITESETTVQSSSGFDADPSKLPEEEASNTLPLKIDKTESSSTEEHVIDAKPTDEIDSQSKVETDVPKSEHDSPLYSSQVISGKMDSGDTTPNDALTMIQNNISHTKLENDSQVAVDKDSQEYNSKTSIENNSEPLLKNHFMEPLENLSQAAVESTPSAPLENDSWVPSESKSQESSEIWNSSAPLENDIQMPMESNSTVMLQSDDSQKSEEKTYINDETYNHKPEESSISAQSLSDIPKMPEASQEESPERDEMLESNEKLSKQSFDDSASSQHVLVVDNQMPSTPAGNEHSFSASPNIETSSEKNPLNTHDTLSGLQEKEELMLEEKEKETTMEIPEDKVSVSEPKLDGENSNYKELPKGETEENSLPSRDILEQSSTNWFSPVSSVMNSIFDMLVKSDIGVDDGKTVQEFTTEGTIDMHSFDHNKQSKFGDLHSVCEKDNFCDQSQESVQGNHEKDSEDFISHSIPGLGSQNVSPSTLVCLIVTSIAILLFSLGYYYLENLRQDTELAARINSLSAELFFAQKELATAEEQLAKTNENFQRLVSNTSSNEEALVKMKQELEENEDMKQKLEQEIKRLEKEIESLVESSNEMHRMLAESISEDERTQALLANIDDLKSMVSSKLDEVSSLTNQLDKEKQEVELLTIALKKSEEKKEIVEEKLEKVVNEIDAKAMAVTKEFEEKIISLERIIEENSLERANFEKEIYELEQKCEGLSLEKELAEKSLKKAQGLGPGKALADWHETKEVRVELMAKQKEVEKLNTELQESKDVISNLQEREKELLLEIESLNNNYETAEKNKIEALTKLQVLSNYFKEKETQLQEELGEKEAQWLQKQSEDHTIYEQMRSLREENLSYKAQNEALKREILDQETSFKIQIANEEQKAQEHWIQLRHTERRLKEAQMEAAHLRSRLTAHETNPDSIEDKHNKSLDLVNGEVGLGAASPPFMLYPPPDFIPPPPLISPSRPPPLGRLSSPPLTPPPPLSPYDIFPPPPSSPPPPLRVHKPQPREPSQKQKDSQSSNHSSESTEKPLRRGKR